MKGFQTENKSNYWLVFSSFFVPCCCLGCLVLLDMTISPIEIFFYTPLQHVLFIGPAIYGYTQSLLNANFNFTKKKLHLCLAFILDL
jgi:hypothetical protein